MKIFKIYFFLLLFSLSSSSILAHEGHGNYQHSVLHYIYSAEHVIYLLAIIIAIFMGVKAFKKIRE